MIDVVSGKGTLHYYPLRKWWSDLGVRAPIAPPLLS